MHFTVLVVVDGASADTPEKAAAVAGSILAPFDENLDVEQVTEPAWEDYPAETYWHNPRGKWDWYMLGGRWSGFFPLKPGAEHLIKDHTQYPESEAHPGCADLARVRDIDFDTGYRDAEIEGEELFARFAALVEQTGTDPEAWETWASPYSEEQRKSYWDQPLVKAMKAGGFKDTLFWMKPDDFFFGKPDAHQRFIQNRRLAKFATFAVLNSEGWHEKPGDWGATPQQGEQWNQLQRSLFTNLPDDAWLAVYDLHS